MSDMLHNQPRQGGVLTYVADNLRRLRRAAGLSQAALAERAGLGRRTINAMEAGDMNISLSKLDGIAAALGTTFVELVSGPGAPLPRLNVEAWRGSSLGSVATLLGAAPASREVQLWHWRLGPGDRYQAEPDPAGWTEMIFVTEGVLRLVLGGAEQDVPAGEFAIYRSDQDYAYFNASDSAVSFVRNVVA